MPSWRYGGMMGGEPGPGQCVLVGCNDVHIWASWQCVILTNDDGGALVLGSDWKHPHPRQRRFSCTVFYCIGASAGHLVHLISPILKYDCTCKWIRACLVCVGMDATQRVNKKRPYPLECWLQTSSRQWPGHRISPAKCVQLCVRMCAISSAQASFLLHYFQPAQTNNRKRGRRS